MSHYWDPAFLRHLNVDEIRMIVEVGARYGDESLQLAAVFPRAEIHSFECNPRTLKLCQKKLHGHDRIHFYGYGLGSENTVLPFYSFIQENDGASSFLKRIDFKRTQRKTGTVKVRRLSDLIPSSIDLLCMDVQGYELNVLLGTQNNPRYVIMEEPKNDINRDYLPPGVHSKYIGAPTAYDLKRYMESRGFVEVARVEENKIEDNVMYASNV